MRLLRALDLFRQPVRSSALVTLGVQFLLKKTGIAFDLRVERLLG